MAVGTISKPYSIKHKKVLIESVSIPSDSYYTNISSYIPTGMNNFLFAVIKQIWSTTARKPIFLHGDGRFVYGDAGSTIDHMEIMYFYTD